MSLIGPYYSKGLAEALAITSQTFKVAVQQLLEIGQGEYDTWQADAFTKLSRCSETNALTSQGVLLQSHRQGLIKTTCSLRDGPAELTLTLLRDGTTIALAPIPNRDADNRHVWSRKILDVIHQPALAS